MKKLQSEKPPKSLPNVNTLLKISLGLILFTIISSALVYAETVSVDIEGNSFDVEYTATGMTVSAIEADTELMSLILFVDVTESPGTLDITFDRSFFDSTYQGTDEDFFVLADGDEPNFTETNTTSQSRTLSIELPAGTEDVEIIGSVFNQPIEQPEPVVEEKPEPVVEEKPEPVVEEKPEPVVEEKPEPVVEEKPEPVVEEKPRTECGPGTVLEDGICVLDERCGPGTVLEDGICVLEPTTIQTSEPSSKGMGKELVIGIIAAFVVAGVVGIILGLMSKASKSRN